MCEKKSNKRIKTVIKPASDGGATEIRPKIIKNSVEKH